MAASSLALATFAGCAPTAGGVLATTGRATSTADARLEDEVLRELNRARSGPGYYAAALEQLLPLYSGTLLRRPGWSSPLRTTEGAAAAREAIGALRAQTPLPVLTLSAGLTAAARDLVRDQRATGRTGHIGANGSTTANRIAQYGTWTLSYAENIDYGPVVSGRDVIEDLLIDDGVADRGHRRNIFQESARVAGVACGPHPKYGAVCVIVQAGGFTPR